MVRVQSKFNGLKNVPRKNAPTGKNINVYLSYDEIKKLEVLTIDEDIPRNMYVRMALQHYWDCEEV